MISVTYYVACTVDGFIAAPDGGIEWLQPFERTGEDYGYAAFYESIDAVVSGRRTYEQARSLGGGAFPRRKCWVFSRRELSSPPQAGVVVTRQEPRPLLEHLAAQGHKHVWLLGGGELAAAFRAQGLITQSIVSIVPVLLGSGIPLFAPSSQMQPLQLVSARTYDSGVVQVTYRHPRAV
jgi:dihydrofolate reductase